jgi:hypothetical protein
LTLDPDPESGVGFFYGSWIPTPYFLELSDKFLGIKFYNSLKTGPNFFLVARVSDPDPYPDPDPHGSAYKLRIRIRIQEGKMTQKDRKKG